MRVYAIIFICFILKINKLNIFVIFLKEGILDKKE